MALKKNKDLHEVTGLSKELTYESEITNSRKEMGTSINAADVP
jgi:hypothetical protein